MYTSQQINSRIDPMHGCAMSGIIAFACALQNTFPMVHGPTGCAGGYRLVPLLCNQEPLLPTTAIYQYDLAIGTTEKLKQALYKAHEVYNPKYIFVVLTCATSMAGEDYNDITKEFDEKTNTKTFVIDGSAFFGEERDGYIESYNQFVKALNIKHTPQKGVVALDGLSLSSFGATNAFEQLCDIIKNECKMEVAPSISVNFSADDFADYAKANVLKIGHLFNSDGLNSCLLAPIGAEGTFDFIKKSCEKAGVLIPESAYENKKKYDALYEKEISDIRTMLNNKAVMVEADGFYAYWLCHLLHKKLGMKVYLTTDEPGFELMESTALCEKVYADMGGYELDFECKRKNCVLALGSTNLNPRERENILYIPYSSPCWDAITEYPTYFGYEAGLELLKRIKEGCGKFL